MAGCASSSVESRRRERFAAYSGLPSEFRQLVDQGQIKVGMSADAVYIAWGQPSDIIEMENDQGRVTVWIYHGQTIQEARYWTFQESWVGGHAFIGRYPVSDFYAVGYVRAEIEFQQGVVTRWRTLPKPPN